MKTDKLSITLEKSDFPDDSPQQLWIDLGSYGKFQIVFGCDEVRLVSWLRGKKIKVTKRTLRH